MRRSLLSIEQKLKDQLSKDKTDPEVYCRLRELIEAILTVKKKANYSDDISNIAHEMATDLYLRIRDRGFELTAPTYYIYKSMNRYISSYFYYNYEYQTIFIDDIVDQEVFRKRMYHPMRTDTNEDFRDTLSEIPSYVIKLYDKYVRYYKDTQDYRDTKVSVLLSIYHQKTTTYGCAEYLYVDYLYRLINRKLSKILIDQLPYSELIDYNNNILFIASNGDGEGYE